MKSRENEAWEEEVAPLFAGLLRAAGFPQAEDDPLAACLLADAVQWGKGFLNREQLPKAAARPLARYAAGQYLLAARGMGRLPQEQWMAEPPVCSVTEGDTSVTFLADAAAAPEQRFDRLLQGLLQGCREELARLRRLSW